MRMSTMFEFPRRTFPLSCAEKRNQLEQQHRQLARQRAQLRLQHAELERQQRKLQQQRTELLSPSPPEPAPRSSEEPERVAQ